MNFGGPVEFTVLKQIIPDVSTFFNITPYKSIVLLTPPALAENAKNLDFDLDSKAKSSQTI